MTKISTSSQTIRLSPRQEQIRRLMLERMRNKQIARTLKISDGTLKTQKSRMAEKFEISVTELQNYLETDKMYGRTPNAEDASRLEGHWISRFRFLGYVPGSRLRGPKYRESCQINLEKIRSSGGFLTHTGRSVCGARADSAQPYEHELDIQAAGDNMRGFWRNRAPAHASGCFQLYIQKGCAALEGSHLGMTANSVVKTGEWVWLRLSNEGSEDIDPKFLRSFRQLNALFERGLNGRRALSVKDLFDRPDASPG